MELRKDFTYSLVVPTSMGLRLTPKDNQPIHCSESFSMYVTSAETNVASISSYLGLRVKALTTFVKDSPIAALIKSNLKSRNIEYEGKEVPQGVPGDIVTKSILPTPGLEQEDQWCSTTGLVRSEGH